MKNKKRAGMISSNNSQPSERIGGYAEYSHLGRQWSPAIAGFPFERTMCSSSLPRQLFVQVRLQLSSNHSENLQKTKESRGHRSQQSRASDYPRSIGFHLSLLLLPREPLTLSLVASLFAKRESISALGLRNFLSQT